MDLIEMAFKDKDNYDLRLSTGGKWLFWDDGKWIVLERKPYAKKNKALYQGGNLDAALDALLDRV